MEDPAEGAELEAFRDFYGLVEDRGGGRRLEVGGAVAGTVAGLRDVLMVNRVLGLGVEEPVTEGVVDEIEGFFRAQGTRYYVSVSPAAAGLQELLAQKGYETGYAWTVFRRGVEPYDASTELEVVEAGPDRAEAFGAVVAAGYGLPPPIAGSIASIVGRPGWHCWLTYAGEEPAGAAALYARGRAGWLGFAATVPEHRRKGSQGALFAARIDKASALGLELLATETGVPRPEGQGSSYRNILRVGFREAYVRPNFVPPP